MYIDFLEKIWPHMRYHKIIKILTEYNKYKCFIIKTRDPSFVGLKIQIKVKSKEENKS